MHYRNAQISNASFVSRHGPEELLKGKRQELNYKRKNDGLTHTSRLLATANSPINRERATAQKKFKDDMESLKGIVLPLLDMEN